MIQRQAVLHIPLSQYAFTNSETSLTIRLRAAKDNLLRCTLYYGDRVYPADPIVFTPLEMKIIASDLYFDYYDATFESPYTRVCYYFILEDETERVCLFSDLFAENPPRERSEFYQYPFLRREEISTVPDWLMHAVVYNIFPDSFATGRRYLAGTPDQMRDENGHLFKSRLGGTIRGISENLDYIKSLGFNCIYINPIFAAEEYHRYDLLDYFHVSPNLGTDDDFRDLVDSAHAMGIRVVIDGVLNHCSWHFFAFDDVVKNGESSRYKDWFYKLSFPVHRPESEDTSPSYSCFAYERKMPKLNSSNPEVREYFMRVCAHWIREFHVDGWRLDVANEIDREFWRAFKRTGRSADPESIMIGEIWESAESWLRGDMFDSTMNYDFRKNCRDFFALEQICALEFDARVTQMNLRYPTGVVKGQLNLLDSHDVSRFLSLCQNNVQKLHLAVIFLVCAPGVPCVFYGDETGISGAAEFDLRGPMPWKNPLSDEQEFFRHALSLRNSETLVHGSYTTLYAGSGGLYIFERRYRGHRILAALNVKNETVPLEIELPQETPSLYSGFSKNQLSPYGYAVWA